MSARTLLTAIVSIALFCCLPGISWGRTGSIWVDYPASNQLFNKSSGSFNAGIGFSVSNPFSGITEIGYCGPPYPSYNPDPQWYGRVEQLDYFYDAYSGSILANLKYRIDSGASVSFADIRMGDNQDKVASINLASLADGAHTATFNAYGIYAERCAYPTYCATCHGNTYVTGPWVRKEGASFAQAALTFRVMSPIAGAPTLISPGHRTFVAPSWFGSDSANLVWSTVTNATKYYLYLTDGGSLNKNIETAATSFDTGSDSSITLQRAHKYSWSVTAANDLGSGTPATAKQFIVGSADCWPEVGSGTGQSHIDTCYDLNSNPEIYRLKDISRRADMDIDGHKGAMGSSAAIITQVGSATAEALTNSINSWTAGGSQQKAIDAHVNSAKVYDYFYDPLLNPLLDRVTTPRHFWRNSFDNNGGSMVNIVENPTAPCGTESACFISIENTVNYTPGSTDSGAIDIVTHEWAHGITATTSRLGSTKELGALNEAFSDWMAIAHKQARGSTNWEVIQGGNTVLRNVADPTLSNPKQPIIYKKKSTWTNLYKDTPDWKETDNCYPDPDRNDNCFVHQNNGVPNKMFYLLANGGSNYEVTVQGIGLARAMQIAFIANTTKWADIYNFIDARGKMVTAAKDLSATTTEINQIKSAWAAVGVGDLPAVTTNASPNPQAGTTVAYRENARLLSCTPANDACIADHRYKSTCCSNETYHTQWGKNVTVEATPNEGFRFVAWTENGATVSTQPTYTISSVDTDRNLTAIFASTTPISLGYASVGYSSTPLDLTIVNFILPTMALGQAQLSGTNASEFAIITNSCDNTSLNQNQETCVIRVAFTPQTSGTREALLTLPSMDGQTDFFSYALTGNGVFTNISLASTDTGMGTVTLQGNQFWGATVIATATPNPGYSFTGWEENGEMISSSANYSFTVTASRSLVGKFSAVMPVITVAPASEDFGLHPIGTSSPARTFTIANTGIQPLSIGTITVSGANGADFPLSSDTCSQHTLPVSTSCTVNAAFTPSGTNLRSATMLIPSGDQAVPVFAVTLTGVSGASVLASGGTGNIGAGYHQSIQEAYNIVGDGSEIKLWAADFNEFLNCNRPVAAVIRGGYNGNFADRVGKSALQGALTISSGSVIIDELQLGGSSYYSTLTVDSDSPGNLITSTPAGINCGSTCNATYLNGSQIDLIAVPAPNYIFTGWSGGGCSVTGSCTLTMTGDTTVTASFSAAKISVAPSSESLGTVFAGTASPPRTITVTSSGTHELTIETLSLSGSNPAEFAMAEDLCSGRTLAPSATCTVLVSFTPASAGAKTVSLLLPSNDPQTPVFTVSLNGIGTEPTISISKAGNGLGTVTSSPSGISCGSSCTAAYPTTTAVTLSAAPDTGYTFSGWSGACSGTGDCTLDINADITVTATFDKIPVASCSANPVKTGDTYYPSIQAAYNATPDGGVIKLLALDFTEELSAGQGKYVILDGGYLCGFGANPDTTVLHGAPRISAGKVKLRNMRIAR